MMQTLTRRAERHGEAPYNWQCNQTASGNRPNRVCKFWLNGNCTRNPCRFLHPDRVSPTAPVIPLKSLKVKRSCDFQRPLPVICKRVKQDQNPPMMKQRTSPENAAGTPQMSKVPQHGLPVEPNSTTQMSSSELNDCGTQKPSADSNTVGSQKPSTQNAAGTPKMSKVPQHGHPVERNSTTQMLSAELNDCSTQRPCDDSITIGSRKPSTQNAVGTLQMSKVPRHGQPVETNSTTQMPSSELNDCDTQKPSAGSNTVGLQKPSDKCSNSDSQKVQHKICEKWIKNTCTVGENRNYMHSWSSGDGFSRVGQLEGHRKAITGISLPTDFDQLFTGSEDGTVRLWNCNNGECVATANVGASVGCMAREGSWVFAGVTNAVKAWNIKTNAELTLDVPAGRVYSLDVSYLDRSHKMLFAGHHDGSIYVWKLNSDGSLFEAAAVLKGHSSPVVSLFYGDSRIYSGAMDNSIRVWDVEKMVCLHTLRKHSDVITSVVCWEEYMLSSSLDNTLHVWATTKVGKLEVIHTRIEQHSILSMCGIYDTSGKPILLCACNDNSVRLYELPSFIERGRIFAHEEVRTIHAGPGGLFFTGNSTGLVSVWKCTDELSSLLNSC